MGCQISKKIRDCNIYDLQQEEVRNFYLQYSQKTAHTVKNQRKNNSLKKYSCFESPKTYFHSNSLPEETQIQRQGSIGMPTLKSVQQFSFCFLCGSEYNLKKRTPFIVCPSEHTFCKRCAEKLIFQQKKCPQCSVSINQTAFENSFLIRYLEKKLQRTQSQKGFQWNDDNEYRTFPLSIRLTKSLKDDFAFFPPKTIVKLSYKVSKQIEFEELLPSKGKHQFRVQILYSHHNSIQIGVAQQRKTCDTISLPQTPRRIIAFNLKTGVLLNNLNQNSDCQYGKFWPAPKKLLQIEVRFDRERGLMKWIVNKQVYAETTAKIIPKEIKLTPFISMFDMEDSIVINS